MEKKIKDAISETLAQENIDLLDVKLGIEDGEKTIFITINHENGVDTELCLKAMKLIKSIIDSLKFDLSEYVLDVGSKGE